jgi:hypothetical protein
MRRQEPLPSSQLPLFVAAVVAVASLVAAIGVVSR